MDSHNLNVCFMKKKLKKISLMSVSEKLSDSQLKHITGGGYIGTGPGSPCYSISGACHNGCLFVYNGTPYYGTCRNLGSNMCGCVQN